MFDLAAWVGIPYRDKGRGPDAFDCWGGVRAVLLAAKGIVLPDYADAYTSADDHDSASTAVTQGLADGWQAVDRPQPFDLLILRIAGRPWHCGLVVARNRFLHWAPKQTSCIERMDAPMWARRIEGVYRCRELSESPAPKGAFLLSVP